MSTKGAGDLEDNKIFKEICMKGMTSGKGDDDRTHNKKKFGSEFERIFGKKIITPGRTKITYHKDGTKTEVVKKA